MNSPPLEILGRYKILRIVGRGAMGIVYEAVDPEIDRVVAIKTINLMLSPDEMAQYEARFKQEIKAAGRLNHPNIVTIYDVGKTDNFAYMAMEFINGCELKDLLKSGQPLPVDVALDIVAQAAEGLAFAHTRDIIHRDVKPANIMLLESEDGLVAKITDFGIARMPASAVKTMTGMVMGSPRYMSPEQVVGKHLSARSDIFSLGVVLYEALTGIAPFESDTISSIMYQTVHVAAQPPSSLNPELGPELDAIVARALAKLPEERYDTMKAFSRAIRELLRTRTGIAGLMTSANFQLTHINTATSTLPPRDAAAPATPAAPIATTPAPTPAVAPPAAPPTAPPAPAASTLPPAPRDDITRMVPRAPVAPVPAAPPAPAVPPAPVAPAATVPPIVASPAPAVTTGSRPVAVEEESERTVWPVSVANQFDSTAATMKLAEITAQTEEIAEFISHSRQMPALKETAVEPPAAAVAPAPAPAPPRAADAVPRRPGISLDMTQMMPVQRKLPMGPLLLLGGLALTVIVLAAMLVSTFA